MSSLPAASIARRFASPWLRGYIRGKISGDPVYAAVLARLRDNDLPILDVGCGVGLLAFYLRESGRAQKVVGIDSDAKKVAAAREAASGHYDGVEFLAGDARELPPFSGNVALLDVLHYLTDPEQRALLLAAAARVAPGGMLLIRDALRDGTLRYRLTWLEETFATSIGWLRVPRLNFPTLESITGPLAGLEREIVPLWGRTPYNNYLFTFRRPATNRSGGGMTNA